MQTPRPDRFTYPQGAPAHGAAEGEPKRRRPWMRAVFFGSLVGAFALGLALSLAA